MSEIEFRIEDAAIGILNDGLGDSGAAVDSVRCGLDQCLREGTPIIVIDALGREIGRVTAKDGDRYVWQRG